MESKTKKKLSLREKTLAFVVERKKPRVWPPIVLGVLLIALLAVFSFTDKKSVPDTHGKKAHENADDSVARISFAGDIMLGRNVAKRAEGIGYSTLFNEMQQLWEDSDFVVANLDTCVIDDDESDLSKNAERGVYFSTDRSNLKCLKEAGIDVVSLATDHIADYGRPTLKTAIDELDSLGIKHVGAGEDRETASGYELLSVKNDNGGIINIAVFGAMGYQSSEHGAKAKRVTTYTPTWDEIMNGTASDRVEEEAAKYDPWEVTAGTFNGRSSVLPMNIAEARMDADVVVVYMHWGDDKMFSENDDMRALAQRYIDAGADVVIGSNPRVVLPAEIYKRGLILYSVGNLIYDDAESRLCDSVSVDLVIDSELNRTIEITPLRISSCVPAETDNAVYVNRIMSKLTKKLEKETYTIEGNKLIIDLGTKIPKARTVIGE